MKVSFNIEGTTFYLVLIFGIFNSVFRYYLLDTFLFPIVYLPVFLMILVVIYHFKVFFKNRKISIIAGLVLVMFFFSFILGFLFANTATQVLMGVYILIPLLYGYTMYSFFERILFYRGLYFFLLIIAILGVLVNVFYVYPWEGFSYEILGKQLQGNRFWTSLGLKRISGLGRSSFETAGYLLFLGIVYLMHKFRIGVVWILTGAAIFFTNSKGIMLTYSIISMLILTWGYWTQAGKKILLCMILLANAGLPLLSWITSVKDISASDHLTSFEMRLQGVWPEAYELISESGSIITGRGLGGIGVPQNLFEPNSYNPADNLFVYLTALFGFSAFLLYLLVFKKVIANNISNSYKDRLFYILTGYVLIFGITTNIIELPIMAICLGLVFRYWTENKEYETV